MLIVICAWCGRGLGTRIDGLGISHGCCPKCADKLRTDAQRHVAKLQAKEALGQATLEEIAEADCGLGKCLGCHKVRPLVDGPMCSACTDLY